jgi:hypothetical protein
LSSGDEKLSDCLEQLNTPAALVAGDLTVLLANSQLRRMLFIHDVVGLRIGKALGCSYASLPGRCGEASVCLQCEMRKAVVFTHFSDGRLSEKTISLAHTTEAKKTFTLTTEKAGEAILMMITACRG